jgi:hypothetical protein
MSQGKLSGNPSARSRVRQRIPVRGTWPWLGKWIDRVAESWARFARLRPAGAHGHGSTRFASSARDKRRRAAFRRGIAWGGGLARSATTTTSSPRRPTGSGQQMESFYKAAQAVSAPLGGGEGAGAPRGAPVTSTTGGTHAPPSNAARRGSQDTDTQSRGSPSSCPKIYSNMLSTNTHSEAAASVTTAASLLPRCALPSSVVFDVSDSMRSDQGMIERF